MFQFPPFPSPSLCVQLKDVQAFPWTGSPIRASPDLRSMTAPRGFSQPSTPFVGS